jgi:hypothetical protein
MLLRHLLLALWLLSLLLLHHRQGAESFVVVAVDHLDGLLRSIVRVGTIRFDHATPAARRQ